GDREIGAPRILDRDALELPLQRVVEMQVIEQRVARKCVAPESPAGDKDVVDAAVDLLGREPDREAAEHGRARARAAQDVEADAAVRKGLVDADMGRTEPAAAGADEAERAAGQEAVQAPDVRVVG